MDWQTQSLNSTFTVKVWSCLSTLMSHQIGHNKMRKSLVASSHVACFIVDIITCIVCLKSGIFHNCYHCSDEFSISFGFIHIKVVCNIWSFCVDVLNVGLISFHWPSSFLHGKVTVWVRMLTLWVGLVVGFFYGFSHPLYISSSLVIMNSVS